MDHGKERLRVPELETELTNLQGRSRAAATLSKVWSVLGPGTITGAADDDPSGIAT